MNEKWIKLIKYFEENKYQPKDIAMIVHFYDLMTSQHELFKQYYSEEDEGDTTQS